MCWWAEDKGRKILGLVKSADTSKQTAFPWGFFPVWCCIDHCRSAYQREAVSRLPLRLQLTDAFCEHNRQSFSFPACTLCKHLNDFVDRQS